MGSKIPSWLVVTYIPTSLFSLRSTYSTSSGGKSLFMPTPYACKLAMIDAAFRAEGESLAKDVFDLIKHREVRFNPPKHLTVNHTFIKIKREPKKKVPTEPYISTIAFREFCYFDGSLEIALEIGGLTTEEIKKITWVFAHINYFGKRGSFFQFNGAKAYAGELQGFTLPVPPCNQLLNPDIYRVTQFLDDIGEYDNKDLFERVNSYSSKKLELGKHRVLKPYLLPYKQVASSKSYTYYHNDSK